jgi:hypothetical protein
VDQQVTLAPGQSATIVDAVAVAFIRVQADSRCPADAVCIQGGYAPVQLRMIVIQKFRDRIRFGAVQIVPESDQRQTTQTSRKNESSKEEADGRAS